ncbi:MAG: hypothetical protein NWR72_10615 [Bacteroidia bacterium]|nr:hypothetical protein [Bacteroidia bacterium]
MAKQPNKQPSKPSPSPKAAGGGAASMLSGLKPWQQTAITHGLVIFGFYLIVALFFKPIVFEDKVLNQDDGVNYIGMSHQGQEYREATGEEPLWNANIFSGMPAYQAGTMYDGNWFFYVEKYLMRFGLPRPASYIFTTFVGFFFLLLVLNLGPWMGGLGAAAYALSSYWFIIHGPGHVSKAAAIAYMAFLVASVLLTYRGKYLLGGALTAFFMALEVNANHYQISYYLAIALLIFGIVYFIDAVKKKTLPAFFTASAVVVLAAIVGVGPNLSRVWTTSEYVGVTMRGGSELPATDASEEGLQKDYAFGWSYGIGETFTLLVPNFNGGASQSFDSKSDEYRELSRTYGAQTAPQFTEYWGDQPITIGPVYVGAIVCFLFLLGAILVQGPIKWWLISVTVLSIVLAWGSHSFIASLFFDYFPAYNKFRAPSMTLVLAEFTMPFLGILGLKEFMTANLGERKEELRKALFISAGVTAGLALLFVVAGGLFLDFMRSVEKEANLPTQLIDLIVSYRERLLRADALRSAALILAGATFMLFYLRGAIKALPVIGGLALLVLVDMVPVAARYLDVEEKSVAKKNFEAEFLPSKADTYVLQDQDPNYRVFNLTTSPAYDKITPYHHKSIGGYHAAKMRRYQDVIDTLISSESARIRAVLQGKQVTDSMIQAALSRNTALNMLNTRYIIYNPDAPNAIQNLSALGNAWFVSNVQKVNTPQEEIMALERINPANTAVIDVAYDGGRFGETLGNLSPTNDPTASIELLSYTPRKITYKARHQGEGLAVFSEIYYNDGKGWTAYINGEKVPHMRANYVLRALKVPSGESEIEFRFDPQSYVMGNTIGLIFSILTFLLLAFAIVWEVRKSRAVA